MCYFWTLGDFGKSTNSVSKAFQIPWLYSNKILIRWRKLGAIAFSLSEGTCGELKYKLIPIRVSIVRGTVGWDSLRILRWNLLYIPWLSSNKVVSRWRGAESLGFKQGNHSAQLPSLLVCGVWLMYEVWVWSELLRSSAKWFRMCSTNGILTIRNPRLKMTKTHRR